MPTLKQLRNATTPVTVKFGPLDIQIEARLNLASENDATLQSLVAELNTLGEKHAALKAKRNDNAASLLDPLPPAEPEWLQLRDTCANALSEAAGQFENFRHGEKIEDVAAAGNAVADALTRGLKAITEFDARRDPDDAELDKRTRRVNKKDAELEKQLAESDALLRRNLCAQFVHLVESWDLTEDGAEGEEPKPLPLTTETVLDLTESTIGYETLVMWLAEVRRAAMSGPFGIARNASTS